MRRRAIPLSGVLLAVLALTLGLSWSAEAKKEPARAPVEVTYYYLPG